MLYNEFIEKYGEIKVKFNSYYKYSFSFSNESTGLYVSVGGNSEDIYKFDVSAGKEYTVKELEPNFASLNNEIIYNEPW